MTNEELTRIAAERGFRLVPADRIKTVEAETMVTHEFDVFANREEIESYVIENIGHEIAVKLAEFKAF